MRNKTHEVLIERFHEGTGRTDCTAVVVIQKRARWVVPLTAGLVAVALIVSQALFDPGIVLRGLIVGAIVGVTLTFLMTGYWLARCGDSVVLVETARGRAGPHTTVAKWSLPVDATIGNGFGTKRITLNGESYVMSAMMLNEFRSITGAEI